jgi:hypothetical protein
VLIYDWTNAAITGTNRNEEFRKEG